MKKTALHVVTGLIALHVAATSSAAPAPAGLLGDWSLDFESETPGWIRISETDGNATVQFRYYIGGINPYHNVDVTDGRLKFETRKRRKKTNQPRQIVEVGLSDGQLNGTITRIQSNGETTTDPFTGTQIPPMPKAPDLTTLQFGPTISLFNGKNLEGWRPHEDDKLMGWSAEDGTLKNTTPKTDFSATGAYANLRTVDEFEDFKLHIEFLIGTNRNSGIYVRGMYEAQVVDRDSRMQGISGVGAIFGTIAPSMNAGKVGGEWQSYDITLVDRHMTVVLNGQTVIDNQPVPQPTAGAIYTNPSEPGPIYLQGDHTSVAYRNIYLTPILKD